MTATTTLRRTLTVAVLAAALTGVAGCGTDPDDPETSSSGAATSTPSTSSTDDPETSDPATADPPPEVEPPAAPPEMAVDDTVGATATVYYFLNLYDYTRTTGDARYWESISSPDCTWCAGVLDDVTSLDEQGGWVESPGLEFDITTSQVQLPDDDAPYYTVVLDVTVPPVTIHNGDGTTSDQDGQHLEPMGVQVQYADGGFTVLGVGYEVS